MSFEKNKKNKKKKRLLFIYSSLKNKPILYI